MITNFQTTYIHTYIHTYIYPELGMPWGRPDRSSGAFGRLTAEQSCESVSPSRSLVVNSGGGGGDLTSQPGCIRIYGKRMMGLLHLAGVESRMLYDMLGLGAIRLASGRGGCRACCAP